MNKLLNFLSRNEEHLREDAGQRPDGTAPPEHSKLDGRTRLHNAAAIAVDRITADPQSRETFDEASLNRLAASMKEHGQLQPIRVRWEESRGVYVIIAGERRWRAARIAGLPTIDCVVVEDALDPAAILRQQIIENALREDLPPAEKAKAFKAVMDAHGWNGKQLAEQLHLDPSTVSRALAILKLDDHTQTAIDAGEIAATVAIRQVQKSTGRASQRRAGPRVQRSVSSPPPSAPSPSRLAATSPTRMWHKPSPRPWR